MAVKMTEKLQKKLKEIKSNIEMSWNLNRENALRFNRFRSMVFRSTLTDEEMRKNESLDRPALRYNIMEAFASRICGDYSSADPSPKVSIDDRTKPTPLLLKTSEVVEGYLRYVFFDARQKGHFYDLFMDCVSGGFSNMEVSTDYIHDMSFDQCIKIKKSVYPVYVGHDPLAQEVTKADGKYSFHLHPMYADEGADRYDIDIESIDFSGGKEGLKWFFNMEQGGETKKVMVIADYYEKETKMVDIIKLSDGQVVKKEDYDKGDFKWDKENPMALKPKPVEGFERKSPMETIVRYQLCGNAFIAESQRTELPGLPDVYFQSNSITLADQEHNTKEMSRPYLFHAEGAQRLMDLVGNTLANECQRLSQHKAIVFEESLSPAYLPTVTHPSEHENMVVRAFDPKFPTRQIPSPIPLQRSVFPTELFALFQYIPTLFQNILGNYDNQMGADTKNALSGVAIVQSQMHSNAASKPIVARNLQSLTRVAELVVGLIPKFMPTPMSIPIIDKEGKHEFVKINDDTDQKSVDLQYDPHDLHVKVEMGPSFSVQKTQAMMMLTQLAQTMPIFGQFMNEKGLKILADNLDIKGSDLLKELAEEYMQELKQRMQQQAQAAQQQAQNTPAMIHEAREAKKDQVESQIEMIRLAIEEKEIKLKEAEIMLKAKDLGHQHAQEREQMQHEKNMSNHQKEIQKGELGNKILQTVHQHMAHEAQEKRSTEKREHAEK